MVAILVVYRTKIHDEPHYKLPYIALAVYLTIYAGLSILFAKQVFFYPGLFEGPPPLSPPPPYVGQIKTLLTQIGAKQGGQKVLRHLQQRKKLFQGPISMQYIGDPAVGRPLSANPPPHIYQFADLRQWINRNLANPRSPMTRTPLQNRPSRLRREGQQTLRLLRFVSQKYKEGHSAQQIIQQLSQQQQGTTTRGGAAAGYHSVPFIDQQQGLQLVPIGTQETKDENVD